MKLLQTRTLGLVCAVAVAAQAQLRQSGWQELQSLFS